MTLCLAGICEDGEAVVCVFDKQLTLETPDEIVKLDSAIKGARIHRQWALFFAGDDISLVSFIIDRIKNRLRNKRFVTLAEALSAVIRERDAVVRERISTEVLGFTGYTLPRFLREGSKLIGDEDLYGDLLKQVSGTGSGCDLLLFGFGLRSEMTHILLIPDRKYGVGCDREGYGAVGCGRDEAYKTLSHLKYSRSFTVNEAVYSLCGAKFSAEDDYVGKTTHVFVMKKKDAHAYAIDPEKVRSLWNTHLADVPGALPNMPRLEPIGSKRSARPQAQKAPRRGRKVRPPSQG